MYYVARPTYPHFFDLVAQLTKIYTDSNLDDIWTNPDGQYAIQTDIEGSNDWKSGIGKSANKNAAWEKTFRYINVDLKNTPVEDYINWIDIPVYRTRLMLSRPKSCYTIHNDYSPRLHLPLVTNFECKFLIIDPIKLFHLPATGETYWVDTRRSHTFLNTSLEPRLHLVMIVEK